MYFLLKLYNRALIVSFTCATSIVSNYVSFFGIFAHEIIRGCKFAVFCPSFRNCRVALLNSYFYPWKMDFSHMLFCMHIMTSVLLVRSFGSMEEGFIVMTYKKPSWNFFIEIIAYASMLGYVFCTQNKKFLFCLWRMNSESIHSRDGGCHGEIANSIHQKGKP